MPETSNPFRRPHSARSVPVTPVDEKLVESIFGVQEQPEAVQDTSGRASEAGNEGDAAERRPKSKPPPPPPAPRRRGTQKTNPPLPAGLTSPTAATPADGAAPIPECLSRISFDAPLNNLTDDAPPQTFRTPDAPEVTASLPPTDYSSRPQSGDFTNGTPPTSPPRPGTAASFSNTLDFSTPRSSHDLDPRPLDGPITLERRSNIRIKPPPPKPRTRSSGSTTHPPDTPTSQPPSSEVSRRSSSRAEPSTISASDDIALSPPRPEDIPAAAASPVEVDKRVPPPPPLSRRTSVRVSNTPEKKGRPKSMIPPPPPPVRRGLNPTNRMSWHDGAPDVASHPPLPLPPTPPHRRHHGALAVSHDENADPTLAGLREETGAKADGDTEHDILVDLEALQREVDELRGKYETKGC